MEAIAKTKHLKGSPRKARLVIDMIRGQNVSRALAILKFTDKRAADPIAKCLNSAIANATYKAEQQNIAIDPDDLWIRTCFVDMGPTKGRRRMRPAPQGRAYREQRHYCHITIQVTSEEGHGSRFSVFLAIAPGRADADTPVSEAAPGTNRRLRLLVVDDEEYIRDLVTSSLRLAGFTAGLFLVPVLLIAISGMAG